MTGDALANLRQDTRDLFYHGYTNYMSHAFPEDELRPISCKPQTRNRDNPADIGLNDVLGNYSLTLIDSLSTLAILASGQGQADSHDSLRDFKDGIKALVELYGDGSEERACGSRACAFDLDSKVQVFETNIRGVGGLLSAHLFAVGDLPIRGYKPVWVTQKDGSEGINWKGFVYNGQLLRLAHDLATRLLPAFNTPTGLPYPRVNLRHGIPFYRDAEEGVCRIDGTSSNPREITETCAAGAGSLVLEFSTLSRLTGDDRFEELAKKAFWAVWQRRSSIGLVGNGIDAETGEWTMPPLTGIGAGIDSFFEYAFKSSVLLSGLPYDANQSTVNAPELFLETWQQAHAAVKHHILRSAKTEKHPYYGQNDLISGAPRYSWVDNLSAYYPGLLTLAGELDEAIESHLVFAALWTRYAALPERWHVPNTFIDPNFRHWAGRPEFIESSYYLYQATKDPFYLHVGEMTLRDIRRRCWTRCGWADLGDVVSGEQRDRMESFFLGETAKYLYLLFEEDHPLNKLDAPFVFTTEGHPLIIPSSLRKFQPTKAHLAKTKPGTTPRRAPTCPVAPKLPDLTKSSVVERPDFFHAAALAQLHMVPVQLSRPSPLQARSEESPGISVDDVRSPTNYTFYPWTLPQSLIPLAATSAPIENPILSTLTFPNLNPLSPDGERGLIPTNALQKIVDGVLISSLSNLRLNMVQEPKSLLLPNGDGVLVEMEIGSQYRVQAIANWALGRDEKVLLTKEALDGVVPHDPNFRRVKDLEMIDLVLDYPVPNNAQTGSDGSAGDTMLGDWDDELWKNETVDSIWNDFETLLGKLLPGDNSPSAADFASRVTIMRTLVPAILPTGPGAAPLPSSMDAQDPLLSQTGKLPYNRIFFLDSTLCSQRLPANVAKTYQIIVIQRGECSFNEKLANIPAFAPAEGALQLVVVLSDPSFQQAHQAAGGEGEIIRPLLEESQRTPAGMERRNGIPMCMVDGRPEVEDALRAAANSLGAFDTKGGLVVEERVLRKGDGTVGGIGVKRRYWFESMGVPIVNLIVL